MCPRRQTSKKCDRKEYLTVSCPQQSTVTMFKTLDSVDVCLSVPVIFTEKYLKMLHFSQKILNKNNLNTVCIYEYIERKPLMSTLPPKRHYSTTNRQIWMKLGLASKQSNTQRQVAAQVISVLFSES